MSLIQSIKIGFTLGRTETRKAREIRSRKQKDRIVKPNETARMVGRIVEQLLPKREKNEI